MNFLQDIRLIQGGMGVYVSNWRLARAVAMERPGQTAGTVSGTGLDIVYVRLLQLGDPGGHVRRALQAFDQQFGVDIGRNICARYYIAGGKAPLERFANAPAQTARLAGGASRLAADGSPHAYELETNPQAVELVIASAFAEVWLAKEGHTGRVLINFLHKVELPLVYALYGAMLAGVDGVAVGAGNPDGLPAACARLAAHEPVEYDLPVLYREAGETFYLRFDPRQIAGGRLAARPLARPAFLAIVSLEKLAGALAQSPTQPPDGLIIEHHTAGGHNAGPQGPLRKDEHGQPLYSALDEPDLTAIRGLGLPFWLAGGYGSAAKLRAAREAGATGVQVGSAFALCEDSGMKPAFRQAILGQIKNGVGEEDLVRTTLFSPTGYPFKVVQLAGTLADETVYTDRRRVCDIGLLQQRGVSLPDGAGQRRLFQRCPAAPMADFTSKRGLERNAEGKRCLCNGLLACAGLGQVNQLDGHAVEEPAIVTIGNHLEAVARLSRRGQSPYWARDVVADILG